MIGILSIVCTMTNEIHSCERPNYLTEHLTSSAPETTTNPRLADPITSWRIEVNKQKNKRGTSSISWLPPTNAPIFTRQ